jgi:sulfate adenylyltransferase subunit 1 (EFTu-like GTPase family)
MGVPPQTAPSAASPASCLWHMKAGDQVKVLPSARQTRVQRIVTMDGDLETAVAGQSIMLTLQDEIDASRGSVICAADAPVEVADQFEATGAVDGRRGDAPGAPTLIKLGTRTVPGKLATPKYEINVNTLEHTSRQARWPSTRSASATCRWTNRCRLRPTPTTVTSAASSSSTGSPTTRSAWG